MARAPLLLPALAFVGAIAADAHHLAALAGTCALVACGWRRSRVAGAFALAGLLCAAWRGHPPLILQETHTVRLAGTVVGDVIGGTGASTTALALDDGIVVRANLFDTVEPGERIVVRGRLVPFDQVRNPGEPSPRAIGIAAGLAGEFADGRVVARAGIDARDARAWPARLRAVLSARLRTALREPEATVVAGALWGERGTLPADLHDAFQATGTVHVLVTAGLHLGVVAACVLALLRLCRVPRVAASLAAIVAVVAYAWLSGAHLPSQRAAVMVSVALLARACGMRIVSWNALALAALVVAAIWPASVSSVSFALSFSCVASIVLFARPLEHAFERFPFPARVREALALTVATQIGVWPLSAATFGLLAPYAIFANAIVVPATALAMLAGLATLVFATIPVLGAIAASLTALDVDAILHVVGNVSALPGARIAIAPPPLIAIIGYDTATLVAAAILTRFPRRAIALLVVASLGVLLTTLRLPDGHLTITMLDVGQGDGIVLRTPRGHVILIDSGGRLEHGPDVGGRSPAEAIGERIVLGYLRRQGVRHVDLLVNTHPHGDHLGGCLSIVEELRVDAIADSGQAYGGRAFRDCIAAAHARHLPVSLVRRGMRYATDDGIVLDALAPSEPLLADGPNDVNENSVVLRLTYDCPGCARPFRMLFTGDAGAQSEARMLASGADLSADVLKVGHHGSAYSSTPAFLAAVHAHDALISVGRHNLFGHPAPGTLRALRDAGARVYRTDECGAIIVRVGVVPTITTMVFDRVCSL
ncbi:MAG TPA: DNA internalization-related competence protein ComEC/Rec2 [Candidatus Acidoferrum sp.]|nr:DNA internalization-related competence protein ComEC/Rec2 [Candidatus Acidoferrum sp.]